MSDALETWKEKLEYFQSQEASTADPDQKFALHKKIKEAKAKIAELEAAAVPQSSAVSNAFQADISRIIKYAPVELIGRAAETKLLTDAWDQAARGEPKRPHILTFVALGGEGKTSSRSGPRSWRIRTGRGATPSSRGPSTARARASRPRPQAMCF